MPRPARHDHEGAWHHVMNRGAARTCIYRDDRDREAFLDALAMAGGQAAVEIHGYCLMSNHFHVLVRSREGKLSEFLRRLAGPYSKGFNARWRCDGPLFRSRCHTVMITSDAQLVLASRYIHLNPVVAGLASTPANWFWSSAAAYLGRCNPPAWLETSAILAMFAGLATGFDFEAHLREGVDASTAHFYNEIGR